MPIAVQFDASVIAEFCRRNHIRKLALFGSVLREDFSVESDVDVLAEFDRDHVPGFLALGRMERELSERVGHPVEIRTPEDLSPYFRDEVLQSAEIQYGQ